MPPPPIQAYAQTFELEAEPEALRTAAGAVRALGLRAIAAQLTVDDAADQVQAEEAWLGETAENYQDHRRRLTGDLSSFGYEAGRAADLLDDVADLLTWFQAALSDQRAALASVPSTEAAGSSSGAHTPAGTIVTYHPRTDEEANAVSNALDRVGDLRVQLDEYLAQKERALRRVIDGYAMPASLGGSAVGLAELARSWQPPTVRHLNWNIAGQAGVGVEDMDEIADTITREGADVVTLQEVWHEDVSDLMGHLDGNWAVYYGHASNKRRGLSPENWSESFGNVVLVRQDDGLESRTVEEDDRVGLDVPGSNVDPDEAVTASVSEEDVPWEDSGPGDDGEGRSAAVAEVTVDR